MRLKFEDWIENSHFSDAITNIFSDAIVCYRNGVYRPALLLSYIGFMNIIRERILSSDGPKLFEKGQWEQLQRNIVKDETWEKSVFEATQQREKIDLSTKTRKRDPIFSIAETIREQILYWKNRRNDCAHFKSNHIDSFHVEAFWAFLQSNLSKITIEGGKDALLNKITRHFDITYTPANTDEVPIIKEIEYSVDNHDLDDFWKACFSIIDYGYEFSTNEKLIKFIEKTLINSNNAINESLLAFIKNEKAVYYSLLSKHPNRILSYNYEKEEIRHFWKKEILECDGFLNIYSTMLNASLIPKAEIKEANEHIISKMKKYEVDKSLNSILVVNGFAKMFEEKYFDESEYQYYNKTNDRADLLYGYLLNNDFNEKIVNVLCVEYSKSMYYSNWLFERLERLFGDDSNKKTDFLKIATNYSITIPAMLNDILQ
jgi:hypothetical protein